MNGPLYVFLGLVLVFVATLVYFAHHILAALPLIIAEHARTYARAYAKATCLILITAGAAFKEAFGNLTAAQASAMLWWDWAILFWMPITAALGVIIAFLDTSVAAANAKRTDDAANNTRSPFDTPPSPAKPPAP